MGTAVTPVSNLDRTGGIKISALGQADIDTPAAGTYYQIPHVLGNRLKVDGAVTTNEDETTGVEGPTEGFVPMHTAAGDIQQTRLTPNLLLHMLAFWMGQSTDSSVGVSGVQHVFGLEKTQDLKAFTLVQQMGNSMLWEEFPGCFWNEVTLAFADGFVGGTGSIISTGKRNTEYIFTRVDDLDNVTTLTVSPDIKGSDDAERTANIDKIRVKKDGEDFYTYIQHTASPLATTITIPSLGGAGATVTYEVFYREDDIDFADIGTALPEGRLKITDAELTLDGRWNPTTKIVEGGEKLGVGLFGESFELKLSNALEMIHPAAKTGQLYASEVARTDRVVTATLSRRMKDAVYHQIGHLDPQSTNYPHISLQFDVEGVVIDSGDTERYGARIAIPKMVMENVPETGNEKAQLADNLSLVALVDPTLDMIAAVGWNTVANYIDV